MAKKKHVYLEDVADRALRLVDGTLDDLEHIRRQHRRKMKEPTEDGEQAEFELDLASINALDKTTRSLNGLLREIRALEKSAKESVGKLGHTQRQELLFDWFSKLDQNMQHSILTDLNAIYQARRVKALTDAH